MLLRTQGRAAWRRFNEALAGGRVPHREVIDGVLVIFGGVLLLTPGFITDIFGLLFLFPPTRVLLRAAAGAPRRAEADGLDAGHGDAAQRPLPPSRRRRGHRRRHRPRPAGPAAMSAASLEAPRPLRKPGDTDAVTFSWADTSARAVRARAGRVRAVRGRPRVLERARDRVRRARDARRDRRGRRHAAARAGGRDRRRRWSAGSCAAPGSSSSSSTFEALTPPAEYGGRQAVVKAGGMEGYEQLCRVRGTMGDRPRRRARPARALVGQPGLGQDRADARGERVVRGRHRRGARRACARPRRPRTPTRACGPRCSTPSETLSVEEPRLSTTTDEAGRQIRAGLELWVDKDDDYPTRGLGEVVTGLDARARRAAAGRRVLRAGTSRAAPRVGRYDVIRRA